MDPKFSPEQAKQLLSSPEGKRLIAMLTKGGGLQAAAEAFKKGDMSAAREALQPTLQTQEANELLKKLTER